MREILLKDNKIKSSFKHIQNILMLAATHSKVGLHKNQNTWSEIRLNLLKQAGAELGQAQLQLYKVEQKL